MTDASGSGTTSDLRGIVLGFPFDQLLDRNCKLRPICEKGRLRAPGIHLPFRPSKSSWCEVTPGTGNIVICGTPGSGKTTLALQFARACTRNENKAISAYVALENRPAEIRLKAKGFGWEDKFLDLYHMHSEAAIDSDKSLSTLLRAVLTQAAFRNGERVQCPARRGKDASTMACTEHCDIGDISHLSPTVLVCTLSPRPLEEGSHSENVFWVRYRQLENLLAAGRSLREELAEKPLETCRGVFPLVVVDSLNMMAMRMPTRDQMHSLFKLFRTYETIGVFTVEASVDTPFDSTLADVVIRLSKDEDQGYFMRYLEVEKSRYVNQVYGKHPFKTVSPPATGVGSTPPIPGKNNGDGDPPRVGVVVFPSLHYIVLRTGERSENDKEKQPERAWGKEPGKRWGIQTFNQVLPHNLVPGSVLVVEGPRHTFKSDMATSFLAQGLVQGESGLLLRLHDQPLLDPILFGPQNNYEGLPAIGESVKLKWEDLHLLANEAGDKDWQNLISSQKAVVNVWRFVEKKDVYLFEVDFKTGALLPEEFIQVVRDIILRAQSYSHNKGITRAILDDVSEIGSGYPFLQRSKTSGDIFLPALAHIMRNQKIDLVVTGTTREPLERDESLRKICAVADAVVSCRFCSVFGQRHVVVNSEGIAGDQGAESPTAMSATPFVVEQKGREKGEPRKFKVNEELLEGLVGFDTGFVQRPGVTIHAFQENRGVHQRYNEDVAPLVEALFNAPRSARKDDSTQDARRFSDGSVSILPFYSDNSEAVHDSLTVLAGKPLDRTVLYTVDEFWDTEEVFYPLSGSHKDNDKVCIGRNPRGGLVRGYYANVLLLAYRKKRLNSKKVLSPPDAWQSIAEVAEKVAVHDDDNEVPINRRFWFDHSALETLSCALLDAVIGQELSKVGKEGAPLTKLAPMIVRAKKGAIAQLEALRKLFSYAADTPEEKKMSREDKEKRRKDLPPDAAIYLCWYSQLRDLIDRAPELADKLNVCALPGGGFRGDWFIGVARGSVSPQLGLEILDVLCDKKEGYKRFAAGVGLPLQREFYSRAQKTPAWPRAGGVTLAHVLRIYEHASSRSSIEGYAKFRSALSAICRQLTPLSGLKDGDHLDIPEIVRTLPERIRMLAE